MLSGNNLSCFLSVMGAVPQDVIINPQPQPPIISRNFLKVAVENFKQKKIDLKSPII